MHPADLALWFTSCGENRRMCEKRESRTKAQDFYRYVAYFIFQIKIFSKNERCVRRETEEEKAEQKRRIYIDSKAISSLFTNFRE